MITELRSNLGFIAFMVACAIAYHLVMPRMKVSR